MKIQNANLPAGRQVSKMQNYNAKLKINKIQTPVIASYPEASGDEAIPIVPSRHCESPEASGRGEAIPKMNFSAEGGSSFGGEFRIMNFE